MLDKLIEKVGKKTFATITAALSAAIVTLIAAIERYFATRKSYNKGRADEREIWKKEEELWKKRVEEVKQSNRSLWEKYKEIKSLRKEFEDFKNDILIALESKPKDWRDGQFVFNYIEESFPGLSRAVQFGKKIDCFYKDDKIDEFIKEAYNIYQEHVN